MSWIEDRDSKRASNEENEEYPPWSTTAKFIVLHSTQRTVSCQSTFVYTYMYRDLVSRMGADHPVMPIVTLITR